MTRLVFRMVLALLMFVLTACGGAPAAPPGCRARNPGAHQRCSSRACGADCAFLSYHNHQHDDARGNCAARGTFHWPIARCPAQPHARAWLGYRFADRRDQSVGGARVHAPGRERPALGGLSCYAIFADKEIPWLADSMEYTKPDFIELTITLNTQATWSDGVPLTSKDVVFTFEGQMDNDILPYHAQFAQYVQNVKAVDDQTVVVTFKIPAPRFKFEVLTLKFDTGIPIVPAHVLNNQAEVNAFAGGLAMPHSGPYTLVQWDTNQKILRPARGLVGDHGRSRAATGCQACNPDQHGGPGQQHRRPAHREQ
jgi:hypothetical protein